MNYYNDIKNKLIDDEIYSKVKDYSKERHKVETYYEVGKMLSEAGKHYGENIIGKYAEKLKVEVNKKYSITTLKRIRQFYEKIQKGTTLWHQLSWSHYKLLIPLKKEHIGQIEIYMNYIDKHLKGIYHDKTIGIIITRKNNRFLIEYASDKRILAREYTFI